MMLYEIFFRTFLRWDQFFLNFVNMTCHQQIVYMYEYEKFLFFLVVLNMLG